MFGGIAPKSISQWLDYHRFYLKIDHAYFYDMGGVSKDVLAAIQPYVDLGIVEVTDMREAVLYETWAENQVR